MMSLVRVNVSNRYSNLNYQCTILPWIFTIRVNLIVQVYVIVNFKFANFGYRQL